MLTASVSTFASGGNGWGTGWRKFGSGPLAHAFAIKKNSTTENTDFTDRSRDVLRHPFLISAISAIRG